MKRLGLILGLLLLTAPDVSAQERPPFDDSLMRQKVAERIARNHSVRLNWEGTSLAQLMDSEARLNTVERIKRNHGVQFDWRNNSLTNLMDAEARMNAAKRISAATGRQIDWREHSLITLMEMELRSSGLDLDALKGAAAKRAAEKSTAPMTSASVIESTIDGDFEGWEGETIVKLVNGQIWQQTEYYYEYDYAFMPDVLIYKSGDRWKMKVEGIEQAVEVKRLK